MKNTSNTALCACLLSAGMLAAALCRSSPKVALQEDAETFTLSNGMVNARVSKVTGDLVSLRYHGLEMLATTLSPDFIPEPGGDVPGVYTYCIFTHQPSYPLAQFAEARHIAKLAPFFDWISVDREVNFYYPKEHNAGDKYVYTATQSENPAFGWSSTTKKVGLFFINPSMEYMGGGPTKVELLGHRDTNREAAPCVLNYWRSSHYGGAEVTIAAGEMWEKIIGPVFIYANTGSTPEAIYADAKARAKAEADKWPYEWVAGVDYPKAKDRGAVKGQLVVEGLSAFGNLNVGLTAGEYASPREAGAPAETTSWQRDAKYYPALG